MIVPMIEVQTEGPGDRGTHSAKIFWPWGGIRVMSFSMNGPLLGVLTGFLLTCGGSAQVVVPASPKKFVTRPIGGGSTGGVEVLPQGGTESQQVRYTTRVVLAESRPWTSTDGKTLEAKLIAFEDLVVEAPKGAPQPAAPAPPANPTVIRNGKVRLVSNQKPFELALERLSQADREFIERIRLQHAKKPLPTPP